MIARETWAWAWPSLWTDLPGMRIYDAPDCPATWFGKRIELDEQPETLDEALRVWGEHHEGVEKAYVLWETPEEPVLPPLPEGAVVHVLAVLELRELTVPRAIEVVEDPTRAEQLSRKANGVADEDSALFHDWLWTHYRARGRGFVAVVDGEDVGALAVLEKDGVFRYQDVCTHPDHRRRGVCTGLVGTVASLLEGRQVIVAARDTTPDRIYRRLGFEQVSQVVEIGVPR